jgi:hypothetical protein
MLYFQKKHDSFLLYCTVRHCTTIPPGCTVLSDTAQPSQLGTVHSYTVQPFHLVVLYSDTKYHHPTLLNFILSYSTTTPPRCIVLSKRSFQLGIKNPCLFRNLQYI